MRGCGAASIEAIRLLHAYPASDLQTDEEHTFLATAACSHALSIVISYNKPHTNSMVLR